MKLFSIKDFKIGHTISGFYLCKEKYVKKTRLGDAYIDLVLQDATGKIRAKVWSHAKYFSNNFIKNDIVAVKGSIVEFNNNNELNVKSINALADDSYLEYGYSNSLIIGPPPGENNKFKKYIRSKIKVLPVKYAKFLTKIYNTSDARIEKTPFDKENFFLQGGLFRYTYFLLKIHDSIKRYYQNIDNDKVILCIMIMNIGYIDYYNDDLFTVSKKGKESNVDILGVNLLSRILNNYKQMDDDRDFLKQCILLNNIPYDNNIRFVKYLVLLGEINNNE